MKSKERIKALVESHKKKIAEASRKIKFEQAALAIVQLQCPHENTEKWQNDDGYGSFMVERCLICGLQKDHGLDKG